MHGLHRQSAAQAGEFLKMKSVLNSAARRNMETLKETLGEQALAQAAQAIRLRSADEPLPPALAESSLSALPDALPSLSDQRVPAHPSKSEPAAASRAGQPLANYLAAKRVGNLLYMSGIIAVDPAAKKVIASYDDLPAHARAELRTLGYDTGQLSVDVFEAPILAQSWFVLNRIRELAQDHGATMNDVFKLVQYFRDLRHYPAYNRVRQLFCPAGVVSTVVEVSRMLPSDEVILEIEATASIA
jgi:2-iminobutanoate/2-iminopropanoate deaminase